MDLGLRPPPPGSTPRRGPPAGAKQSPPTTYGRDGSRALEPVTYGAGFTLRVRERTGAKEINPTARTGERCSASQYVNKCFCSAASREAPQSTRRKAGQARPPASDQQPAAHQGLRRGLLVKGCLRNSPATGLPLRPLHGSAARQSHGRRAPPLIAGQRLTAAPPHARPGPRARAVRA